jgi:hypothetical protein
VSLRFLYQDTANACRPYIERAPVLLYRLGAIRGMFMDQRKAPGNLRKHEPAQQHASRIWSRALVPLGRGTGTGRYDGLEDAARPAGSHCAVLQSG